MRFVDGLYNPSDACFIAAAPELYEALENLLGMMESVRPDWQHAEQEGARAALAKARGEI